MHTARLPVSLAAFALAAALVACGPSPSGTDGGKGGGAGGGVGGGGGGGTGGGGGGDECTGTRIICSGSCIEPSTHNAHCGGCDKPCSSTAQCTLGKCIENCGNGRLDTGEQCDDGNVNAGDSCSPGCQREPGWACTSATFCRPICGDGMRVGNEFCDDGDLDAGDGCSELCAIEDTFNCTGSPSVCLSDCGGPSSVDDSDPCTVDVCNSQTGQVVNTPKSFDDGNPCTDDTCDPADGGAIHTQTDPADAIDCTVDSCTLDAGIRHVPNDALCAPQTELCSATLGCHTPVLTAGVITEFVALGAEEWVEIHNPTSAPGRMEGFKLTNSAGAQASIRDTGDLDLTSNTPVIIPAGGYAAGVRNPTSGGTIPSEASFVFGEVGTSFSLVNTGDTLAFSNTQNTTLDSVDFKTPIGGNPAFVTGDSAIGAGQFPAVSGKSTQLHSGSITTATATATANDNGNNWCVPFRANNTLGQPNQSCRTVVINEVLYDFQTPGNATDDGNTFIELAGPGGALLGSFSLKGSDKAMTTTLTPDVTFAAGTRIPPNGIFVLADGIGTGTTTNVPNEDYVVAAGTAPNGTSGNVLALRNASGTVVDKLGYGPLVSNAEGGVAVEDIDPASVGYSLARNVDSADTNNNVADFAFDPTPSPGLANQPVTPTIVSITPMEGWANGSTSVTIVAKDLANLAKINSTTPSGNTAVTATFDQNTVACSIDSAASAGRGNVTLACTAPTNGDVGSRSTLELKNPAFFGTSASTTDGWTYVEIMNEKDVPDELDTCTLSTPATMSSASGAASPVVTALVLETGVTEPAGVPAGMKVQLGYGATGSDPRTWASGWVYTDVPYDAQVGNEDRFKGTMTAPAAGSYAYTFRVSPDNGIHWTYCDKDGAGSATGEDFSTTALGVWTVSP